RSAIAAASAAAQGVDFRLATAERLPFADGELDHVWIFDVLEHVDDPELVLREVARVLKPGGGFHIVLPLEGQPRTLYRLAGVGRGPAAPAPARRLRSFLLRAGRLARPRAPAVACNPTPRKPRVPGRLSALLSLS